MTSTSRVSSSRVYARASWRACLSSLTSESSPSLRSGACDGRRCCSESPALRTRDEAVGSGGRAAARCCACVAVSGGAPLVLAPVVTPMRGCHCSSRFKSCAELPPLVGASPASRRSPDSASCDSVSRADSRRLCTIGSCPGRRCVAADVAASASVLENPSAALALDTFIEGENSTASARSSACEGVCGIA